MRKQARILWFVIIICMIGMVGISTGFEDMVAVVAEAAEAPAAPKASLKSGTYTLSKAKGITLSCTTKGATVYYSLNGAGYKKYTKKLSLTKNSTLKIYAVSGGKKSAVVTYTYKFKPKVTVSHAAGSYDEPLTVTLDTTLKNVKYYYTLDGSKPTKKSAAYTADGIWIDETATLRILAVKSGWNNQYLSMNYTIEIPERDYVSESILWDYTKKPYYKSLNKKEKEVYQELYDAALAHEESVYLADYQILYDDAFVIWQMMSWENPQLFWVNEMAGLGTVWDNGITCEFILGYNQTQEEAAKRQKKLEKVAAEWLAEATEEPNLFYFIKHVHDKMIRTTGKKVLNNDASLLAHVDSVFLDKVGHCASYSRTFMYLCQSIGLECIGVVGDADGDHMWNKVKLDGEWYNLDVTWDDEESSGTQRYAYDYFCLTDEEMIQDHVPLPTLRLDGMVADAEEYSITEGLGVPCYTDAKKAYKALIAQIASNYRKGELVTRIFYERSVAEPLGWLVYDNFYADLAVYEIYPKDIDYFYGWEQMEIGLIMP
ncbi:MAG: chitobiase/beta-hexosaminidase C-terminal domain-containing protein [Lachnospiraceae bacterium]|nr:chitobiase/beta-hexosaminidase C-terminal domain-containing protein [Lachnospiraceae bacterium]